MSDFRRYTWHRHIREYAALEKLHNVERRPDDIAVVAQHVYLRDRHARLGACRGARVVFVDRG